MIKDVNNTWPVFSSIEVDAVKRVLESGKVNYWTGQEGKLTRFQNTFDRINFNRTKNRPRIIYIFNHKKYTTKIHNNKQSSSKNSEFF
jgi:hypothetical protein